MVYFVCTGFLLYMSQKLKHNCTLSEKEKKKVDIIKKNSEHWPPICQKLAQATLLSNEEEEVLKRLKTEWRTIEPYRIEHSAATKTVSPDSDLDVGGEACFNKSPVNDALLVMSTFEGTYAYTEMPQMTQV